MKNILIGFFCLMFLILCGLGISISSGKTMRQNELDTTVTSAVEDALNMLADSELYTTADAEQLAADAIQNSLVQADSNSKYTVTVYTADKTRGFLDVEVTEHYKQPFKAGKVTVRKTAVLEEYNNADDEKVNYTITFSEKEKVVKQLAINRDAKIPASQIPTGYSKFKYNGKTYTAAQLQTMIVNQDMQIVCGK